MMYINEIMNTIEPVHPKKNSKLLPKVTMFLVTKFPKNVCFIHDLMDIIFNSMNIDVAFDCIACLNT